MSLLKAIFLFIFFGSMAALSAAPFNLWICGFIMLFPFFYFLENSNYTIKQSIISGYLFTLTYNVFITSWLIYTITIYGHIHWTLAIIIFLLYTFITCTRYTFFILMVQIWNHFIKSPDLIFHKLIRNRYFSWTLFWGISEYFGWQLFHALGANHAGGDFPMIQVADIVGIYGLSLFWFITNLLLYDMVKMFLHRKEKPFFITVIRNKSILFVSLLLILIHIYGFLSADYYNRKNTEYGKKLIALVQGNAPLAFEENRSLKEQVLSTLQNQVEITENILQKSIDEGKKPDLLVWSESSVPYLSFQTPGFYTKAVERIQKKYNIPMIINDVYVEEIQNQQLYYNNLWLLDENSKPLGYYHKIELLPFGEFIPFAGLYPEAYELVPEISGFSPGKEKKILKLNSMEIIPSICYELLPPTFTLDYFNGSGKQGQIIINITNDTWFGLTTENAQHIKASSLRAIELRLPIIRATNSGISAYIDSTGKIHNPTKSGVKDTRLYEVPIPGKSLSIYSHVGLWPFRIFLLVGFLIWFSIIIQYYVNKKK